MFFCICMGLKMKFFVSFVFGISIIIGNIPEGMHFRWNASMEQSITNCIHNRSTSRDDTCTDAYCQAIGTKKLYDQILGIGGNVGLNIDHLQ